MTKVVAMEKGTPAEEDYGSDQKLNIMFVCADALSPSQQFFSHVGMLPVLSRR